MRFAALALPCAAQGASGHTVAAQPEVGITSAGGRCRPSWTVNGERDPGRGSGRTAGRGTVTLGIADDRAGSERAGGAAGGALLRVTLSS